MKDQDSTEVTGLIPGYAVFKTTPSSAVTIEGQRASTINPLN